MSKVIRELGVQDVEYFYGKELNELMHSSDDDLVKSKLNQIQDKVKADPELQKILATFLACDRLLEGRVEMHSMLDMKHPEVYVTDFPHPNR